MALSTKQVASMLGVHPRTLCIWRRDGVGPPFENGNRITYDYDLLAEWAKENWDGYTVAELAEKTGYDETTLWIWRKRGNGPAFIKSNGRVRYPKKSTDAWLKGLKNGKTRNE